jgi:hypothetical protein
MKPIEHDPEDVLYGVKAIAKALKVKPRQVHRLRSYLGLPTFWTGKLLCARLSELDAWKAAFQQENGSEPTP